MPSFAIRSKIANFSLGAISVRQKCAPTAVIFASNGVRRFKVVVEHIRNYALVGAVYKASLAALLKLIHYQRRPSRTRSVSDRRRRF
jgi:hypothetical protein